MVSLLYLRMGSGTSSPSTGSALWNLFQRFELIFLLRDKVMLLAGINMFFCCQGGKEWKSQVFWTKSRCLQHGILALSPHVLMSLSCLQDLEIFYLGELVQPWNRKWQPATYSCLENSMDRWPWWTTYSPWGRRELDTPEHIHLSSTMLLQFHFIFSNILQTNGISILVWSNKFKMCAVC